MKFNLILIILSITIVIGLIKVADNCKKEGGRFGLMGRIPHCYK